MKILKKNENFEKKKMKMGKIKNGNNSKKKFGKLTL